MHRQEINLNILATKLTENLKEKKTTFFLWLIIFEISSTAKALNFPEICGCYFNWNARHFECFFLRLLSKKECLPQSSDVIVHNQYVTFRKNFRNLDPRAYD